MKKLKSCGIVVLIFLMMWIGVFSVNASEIMPLYDNTNVCKTTFLISDNIAYVAVKYEGNPDSFAQAKVTVKIQKKTLGLFWSTVDIGEPNKEWVAYSNNVSDCLYNTFAITDTGTYRAVFTVEIFGSDGTVDKIEDKIEYKY